jgi:ABC-type Fe3+-hydroxamate transport system substrate-binding protein
MHRHIWAITLAVATGVGTVACGGDDNGATATSAPAATTVPIDAPAASGTSGDAASAFPVTIEHKLGTITVAAAPQRVVSVGYKDQDWLYEFGVTPLAVREWYGVFEHETGPWAVEASGGATPEVLAAELNYEKIAALEPDLIVAVYAGLDAEEYAALSAIAPTLAGPVGSEDYQEPWRDMTRLIGAAVGKGERAEELIVEIEAQIAAYREEYPQFVGAKAIVAYSWSPETGVYSSGDPRAQLLEELGFETPAMVDELAGDRFNATLSGETVGEVFDAADVIVVLASDEAGGTDDGAARGFLEDNALFASSRVNAEGRIVWLDTAAAEIGYAVGSPLSIRFTLSYLVPQLAAALDGDPSTAVPAAPAGVD